MDVPRQIDRVDVMSFRVSGHSEYVRNDRNSLYDFDASKATALKYLNIDNVARSVDVSKSTDLEFFDVSVAIGALKFVDVSACTLITRRRLTRSLLDRRVPQRQDMST